MAGFSGSKGTENFIPSTNTISLGQGKEREIGHEDHESLLQLDSGYATAETFDSPPPTPIKKSKSGVNITQDDIELSTLLGYSVTGLTRRQPPTSSLPTAVPPQLFKQETEQRLAKGLISPAVARYYLDILPRGDSRRIPGQNGRPSLLDPILSEDVRKLTTPDYPGSGWRPKRIIGKGAYGSVLLWEKSQKQGQPLRLASKETLCSSFFQDYCSEGHLTRRLNDAGCKNVVSVVEWKYIDQSVIKSRDQTEIQEPPKHRICYEYAEFSDLRRIEDWYRTQKLILPESFIWHILSSVASALCYCRHGSTNHPCPSPPAKQNWDSIVHGDIKQSNLFLTRPDDDTNPFYPCIKLADFGLAYTLGGATAAVQHYRSQLVYGTDGYIAPEIEDQSPEQAGRRRMPHELHGPHSDIYSLGMTCKHLLSLVELHKPEPSHHKRSLSGAAQPAPTPSLEVFYSSELRDLLDRCTSPDPRRRPKTSRLFQGAKAQMELHRAITESEAAAARRECETRFYHGRVLYTREEQVRYEMDSMFREHYARTNLSELLTVAEEQRSRPSTPASEERPRLLSRQSHGSDGGAGKVGKLVRALLKR